MARDEAPPFGRGESYYNGTTIDANNLGGLNLEGMEWVFEDLDYSAQGVKPARTNRKVRCRCVRNASGAALLGKRLVRYQTTNFGARVDGYTRTTAERSAGVVDEWLPAAGVPNNDLFWMVIEGPTLLLTPLEGSANNSIAQNDNLVALTAATSGATTAGRPGKQDLSGATGLLGDQIQNIVGQALSARTTGNTNVDLLVQLAQQF